MKSLRIVTRSSQLALAQVEWVKDKLNNFSPELTFETIKLMTSGDKFLAAPLYKIGGKALFVKELDEALVNNEADIAVHSVKDIPHEIPSSLTLRVICQREDPFDALIHPKGLNFSQLPSGSVVGTSSLRRMVQLKQTRADLKYVPLRGNVPTRIEKCFKGEYDAIVLAQAGLNRLNLQAHVTQTFTQDTLLPAVGQGAIGIVCRQDDEHTMNIINQLNHTNTYQCVMAERAMNQKLNGSCRVPVAGYATIHGDKLALTGRVGHPDRQDILEAQFSGHVNEYQKIGVEVARVLMQKGAKDLIADLQ